MLGGSPKAGGLGPEEAYKRTGSIQLVIDTSALVLHSVEIDRHMERHKSPPIDSSSASG